MVHIDEHSHDDKVFTPEWLFFNFSLAEQVDGQQAEQGQQEHPVKLVVCGSSIGQEQAVSL